MEHQEGDKGPSAGKPVLAGAVGIDFVKVLAKRLLKLQGERFREERKKAGLTIEGLSERTALHTNTIGRIERGDSEASTEQLLTIAMALGIPPVRLAHFVDEAKSLPLDDEEFALIDMLDVKVSAGSGSLNGHHAVMGRFAFTRAWLASKGVQPQHAKIIRARGDSMADKINNGDILLVDTAVTSLGQDGVYVIELEGFDYVKLVQRDFGTGGVQIISYNPTYKPQALNAEQAQELRISGRVVWHGGEV